MKKNIIAALCLLAGALAFSAHADEIGPNFKQARKFMKEENLTFTATPTKAFQQSAVVVFGEGSPVSNPKSRAQRRATAITAAKVAAQRRLAELLKGVSIVSETTVKNSMLESDIIRTTVNAFIQGAEVAFQEYSDADDSAIVILRMNMTGENSFAAKMYEKILAEPGFRSELEKPAYAPATPPSALPAAVPPQADTAPAVFDGLVIDATAFNFRPALVNRIFTPKGEILYDPAKISQKVLVENGCGEYTNSVDKARAALGKRGVKNPLVVKASGTVNPADLQVSDTVASSIFMANQNSGFMADARVAFVLR